MKWFAATLLAACSAVTAADPAFYARKPTWQETMLASREALTAAEQGRVEKLSDPVAKSLPASFQPFAAETDTGQKGPRHVKVRVSGLDILWLSHAAAQAGGDKPQGVWGEPTLTGKDGKKTRLLGLKPLVSRGSVEVIDGAESPAPKGKGRKRARTVRVGRQEIASGLVVEPDGELCYRLDGQFDWFEADVAVLGGKKAQAMVFRASHVPLAEAVAREKGRATLWRLVERDFATPDAVREIAAERARGIWDSDWPAGQLAKVAQRYAGALPASHPLRAAAGKAKTPAEVLALAKAFHEAQQTAQDLAQARDVNLKALRLAIEDLARTFGDKYPRGGEYLRRLDALEKADLGQADADKARELAAQLVALERCPSRQPPARLRQAPGDQARGEKPQDGHATELAGQLLPATQRLRRRNRHPRPPQETA